MSDDQIYALNELEAFEVSLVDRGANEKKPFPIHKRKNAMGTEMTEIVKAVLETEVDSEQQIGEVFKNLSDEGAAAIVALVRTLTSFKDELPADVVEKAAEIAGYKVTKSEPKPEPKDPSADLLAAMPAEIRKQMEPIVKAQQAKLELMQKALDDSQAQIQKEREDRARATWVTKAREDLAHFPGESTEEMGSMLYEMEKSNPELAQKQFDRMKRASDAIAKSELLKSHGSGRPNMSGNAMDEINKLTTEMVAKSEGKMTHVQAMDQVMKMRPDLYETYLTETRNR